MLSPSWRPQHGEGCLGGEQSCWSRYGMAEQHRAAGEALWGGLTVLPQCGGASGAWETQPDVSALQ